MATSDEMVENALIQLGQALEQQAADAEDKTKRQAAAARAAELLHQKYNGVPAVAPAAAGDTAVIAAPSGAPFQAIHRNGVVALADPATVAASKGDYLPLNEAGMVRTPQGAVSVEVVQSRLDEYFPPKRRFPIRFK